MVFAVGIFFVFIEGEVNGKRTVRLYVFGEMVAGTFTYNTTNKPREIKPKSLLIRGHF